LRQLDLIPCEAPLWAQSGHLETILGTLLPSPNLKSGGERVFLQLPDGDRLFCRLYDMNSKITVALFHGLAGDIKSGYMQRTAVELIKKGYSVLLVNHRNCGEGKGQARHIYNSGRSEDIGFAINYLKKRFPKRKVAAIGFSLSANALLLLMSKVLPLQNIVTPEEFDEKKEAMQVDLPDLAMVVNPPMNLARASASLCSFPNKLYGSYFLYYLTSMVRELDGEGFFSSPKRMSWMMPISEFDNRFTAPFSGFQTGEDYYKHCSAFTHLEKIKTQTAIITAKSDPFVDFQDALNVKRSSSTLLQIEDYGGHMGYIHKENTPLGSNRWLEYALVTSLPALI
jgi:uncharacterized protein